MDDTDQHEQGLSRFLVGEWRARFRESLAPGKRRDTERSQLPHVTHLDPRFAKGGFSSPDDATRAAALALSFEGIDLAGELGAQFIIWPGIEGYNYPFQTPYASSAQVNGATSCPRIPRSTGAS